MGELFRLSVAESDEDVASTSRIASNRAPCRRGTPTSQGHATLGAIGLLLSFLG